MTGWECIRRTSVQVEVEPTSLASPVISFLGQLAENHDSCGSTHEDFAIGNHWSDEFVAGKTVAAICGLIAVVEFAGEIACVIGVQHRRSAVLHRPDDSVRRAVCRNAWCRTGVTEGGGRT